MNAKLVVDSCCDPWEGGSSLPLERVPLSILVNGASYIDDDRLEIPVLMDAIKQSPTPPKSACPAPYLFADAFRHRDGVFAVTLSSKLSGSYASALAGKRMVEEEHSAGKIHVFDSCSASAGEVLVAHKIQACVSAGLPFHEVVEEVEQMIQSMETFFILENLDTLIKAGRMSRITGYVASAMALRPIMTADHGEIQLHEKVRGSVRAFARLAQIIEERAVSKGKTHLAVSHCQNETQARFLQAEANRSGIQTVIPSHTGGISSMYANRGGVVVAF